MKKSYHEAKTKNKMIWMNSTIGGRKNNQGSIEDGHVGHKRRSPGRIGWKQ